MKKNFFKKLSFVMALAMIASLVAPAAGVFAAENAHLNATKKYLHLAASTGFNEFDFNISHAQKGWKAAWTSSNEDVATVDEATGFTTATGVGTAKISAAITDKAGADVTTLEATVVVRDNISTVKISNVPDKALAVAQEYDFNRSFVTVAGSTTETSAITRWSVDSDKATISDSGLFKATVAGEYNVTAMSFQSTEKFEAWKVSKDAKLVLASDTTKVTVEAGIVETKQINSTKFNVTFDSDMSKTDVKTASTVYQIINGKQVSTGTEKIKAITLDSTGKIATVEMYTALNAKTEYNFLFGKLVGKFTAASTGVADIAGIVFDDFNVDITGNVNMLTKVSAVDKNGVVILSGSDISSYLTFSYGGDLTKGYAGGTTAYIYTQGYQAPITATYQNYIYNETTKTYDTVKFTDSAVATGTKADTAVNTASIQYAVVASASAPASDSSSWGAAIAVPAQDGGFYMYSRYKLNSDASDAAYTNAATFVYESSNTDKLLISGNSMYPIAQGSVTVIVKNTADNNKVVGTFDVVIQASRSFAVATIDKSSVQVGNNATLAETATATINVKDSMNAAFTPSASYTIVNRPAGTVVDPTVAITFGTGDNLGKAYVAVTGKSGATPATIGAYNIKVTVGGFGSTKDVYVTAIVVDGTTDSTVANWQLELGSSSVDLKNNVDTDISIDVYGYNSKGVRVDKLDAAEYSVTVKKGDTTVSTNNTSVPVVTASGTSLVFYEVGTYVVTAYVVTPGPTGRVNGAYIGGATFTVSDTTTKSFGVDTMVVTPGTVFGAVKAAFTFKLNGSDITEANITKVTYSNGASGLVSDSAGTAVAATGSSIYVSSIEYTVNNASNGTTTTYTFNVGMTIKVQ